KVRFDTEALSQETCICCKIPLSAKWQPTDVYACDVTGCNRWRCTICFQHRVKFHQCVPSEYGGRRFVIFDMEKEERCGRCHKLLAREKPCAVLKCKLCTLWICEPCGKGVEVKVPESSAEETSFFKSLFN